MNEQEILAIIRNKEAHYKEYTIPKKSGGFRTIVNPSDKLKELQRSLLNDILRHIKVNEAVHGFVEGKGIYTNARDHLNSACIVKIDLKDFFPSIKKEKIVEKMTGIVRTPNAIAEIVTYKDCLPQGAPTSPCMSNIVCISLDKKLVNLAKRSNARYTRYADDLTFSSRSNDELDKIIPKVHSLVKHEGFEINYNKIRVMRKGCRQVVTGLVVNKKLGVPRHLVRKFRSLIHNQIKAGKVDYQKLMGYNSFIAGADPKKGEKYKKIIMGIENGIRK